MKQNGFTLLELIITVAVAATVIALATPSFIAMVQNNRVTAQVNDFVTAVTMARSEAIRRGGLVTLCRSTDEDTCAGSGNDWASGWILIEGEPGDYGNVLRVWSAPTGEPNMIEDDGKSLVTFLGNGAVTDSLNIEHRIPNCTGDQVRQIRLNRTGRTSVTREECNP
ncbi:GspH/FimT family pseudopilin [Gammaproteobacteria bacterium AB-CW1]|uniref:Type II secretion system protein H n=1 Tax=Natronospira elongata TaxID=3110268 RepID=A0AAP6JD12_9GAMM|nr:GspH/FimT family pseudopilin [Gammaproteobacteria bacterium AB-CW1]